MTKKRKIKRTKGGDFFLFHVKGWGSCFLPQNDRHTERKRGREEEEKEEEKEGKEEGRRRTGDLIKGG